MGPRLALGVFLVSVVGYTLAAAPVPFYNKGEPREALVARAILEGHGVVLPRRDGHEMPSKPPLFHWLAALAVRAGVQPEELGMRMPSIVLAAAGNALTAAVTARAHGVAAGVLAAAVLGSSLEWQRAATESRVDMTLAVCVLAAILAWRAALDAGGRVAVRLGYLAAAAAVLTKGPVGLVLPGLVVAVEATLVRRRPRLLLRLLDGPGMAAAAVLCGGWYVLAWWSGGEEFLVRQLRHENLARFTGGEGSSHAHGFFYYLPVLVGRFFPWSVALPAVAWRFWRRPERLDRGLLAWVGTVLLFYSLASGKRSPYLLPLYPALAMLTAHALADGLAERPGPTARRALAGGAAALAALGLAVALGAETRVAAALAGVLSRPDRENLPVTLAVIAAHRVGVAMLVALVALALTALAARARLGARVALAALGAIAAAWFGGLMGFGTYPVALRLTPQPFAERVRAVIGPDDRLCGRGYVDFSVRWYLRRPVETCPEGIADERTFVVRLASSPRRACLRLVVDDERRGSERVELAQWVPGCRDG